MAGVNRATIIGNLGKDPELRYSPSGAAVCNFSMATSEKWKDKNTGEQVEKTEWHRCVSFGKQAEVLGKYLVKGSQVYIEGKLQTRKYEKDGQTHYATEIVVQEFTFLGVGQQSGGGNKPAPGQQTGQHSQSRPQQQNNHNNGYDAGLTDSEIPF